MSRMLFVQFYTVIFILRLFNHKNLVILKVILQSNSQVIKKYLNVLQFTFYILDKNGLYKAYIMNIMKRNSPIFCNLIFGIRTFFFFQINHFGINKRKITLNFTELLSQTRKSYCAKFWSILSYSDINYIFREGENIFPSLKITLEWSLF